MYVNMHVIRLYIYAVYIYLYISIYTHTYDMHVFEGILSHWSKEKPQGTPPCVCGASYFAVGRS